MMGTIDQIMADEFERLINRHRYLTQNPGDLMYYFTEDQWTDWDTNRRVPQDIGHQVLVHEAKDTRAGLRERVRSTLNRETDIPTSEEHLDEIVDPIINAWTTQLTPVYQALTWR